MLFPTLGFLLFFLIVACAATALSRQFLAKKAMLVAASYFFYAQWDWRFCFLLLFSSALTFGGGFWIAASRSRRGKDWAVGLLVACHLLLLGAFKYFDFFLTSADELAHWLGMSVELPFLEVILPVGISFFTFHGISYLVDVRRGDVALCRQPLDMLLYMSFFPQLIAGPIVRASYFLPQLATPSREPIALTAALTLIVAGLFKKLVVAYYLAAELVDPVFAAPTSFGGPDLLLADYAYALQIYCDFSAYSDMAIGIAALLGFRFPLNFNQPYRAQRLREFWQRWHISLSSWLRDYLYRSLGGNRGSTLATYRNIMITMLLGGLWHGAAWKFVAWGGWHGAGLVAERVLEPVIGRAATSFPARVISTVIVFHFVCVGWVFFRATDFDIAWAYLGGLGGGWRDGVQQTTPLAVAMLAIGFGMQFAPPDLFSRAVNRLGPMPVWLQGAIAGIAVAAMDAVGPDTVAPFIYFQF